MYLWRRSAGSNWWHEHEERLRGEAGNCLAVIKRSHSKQLQLEVASRSPVQLRELRKNFGGRVEKLSRDWLKRFVHRKTKPLKVGNRKLIIPAGAAFGTGEHATTAMSLRFLEQLTRNWKPGWSIVDLGTGSGILALAAKRLGAKRALGIDNDPIAISTAKQNARLNNITGAEFRLGDARVWKFPPTIDIVTANLFSELLIEISPKLRAAQCLILSGLLRKQERDVIRAVRQNKIDVVDVRRRGKWVAILAAVK
jgi:ribosomal protein L11 methyltransferase